MAEHSRPTLSWSALWDNLNVEDEPNGKTVNEPGVDRTGVRMGYALQRSIKFDTSSDKDISSTRELEQILSARKLAEWLCGQTEHVGEVKIYKKEEINWKIFKGKKGIMFIKNAVVRKKYVDHIDLWDGRFLKGVNKLWKQFEEVWFWDLWPCVTSGSVKVYSRADAKSRSLVSVGGNHHVEVVEVVDENWVKVNLTKFYAVESIGFIKRDSIECQPVKESLWGKLWEYYEEEEPCKGGAKDQCAIRIGVALKKSGVDLSSFTGLRCGLVDQDGKKHDPSHILRAQELADWLCEQTKLVGQVKKYNLAHKITWEYFKEKRGIMFIRNPHLLDQKGNFRTHKEGKNKGEYVYLGLNHIDLWNGSQLRTGENDYIKGGQQVWFWELE